MIERTQGCSEGESRLEAAALRMARRCRHIIQGCLREEEWVDADREFHAVILEELRKLVKTKSGGLPGGPAPKQHQ